MDFFKPHLERKNMAGVAACLILSIACLVASIYLARQLLPLYNEGQRTHGEISRIEKGAKNSKTAVLLFTTSTGDTVETRDIYQMMFFRPEIGDEVSVLYSLTDPKIATIDFDIWTWHPPALMFLGFIIMLALGIILPHFQKTDT